MGTVKRIVCLANSRKLHGRCVAGRELINDKPAGWVRPVSARPQEEVSEYERQYEDGSDPRVRDVIDVPLLEPRPKDHQQENWLLDPKYYWVKVRRAKWRDLLQLEEPEGPLWINGHSTFNGLNDIVPIAEAMSLQNSLRLIRVESLRLSVFAPGEAFGNSKRRVQATFHHDGVRYKFWVTDPLYERQYLAQPNGEYDLGESFLTISLSEPHKDHNNDCYKLVAAVIERRPARGGR